MTADVVTKLECQSCTDAGRKGYCALGRCYCGHGDCRAAESWVPLPALTGTAPAGETTKPTGSAWDNREGATWIDRL